MDQGKVGNFITELRNAKKMTQAELGDIVGVTGKAVSRWERGLNLPDRGIINKVSEALGVSTTELLNGERVVDLNTENLDKITENSVEYYKAKMRQRFKKILLGVFSGFILFLLGLFMLFYFNNSGSCVVYAIDSDSSELDAEGIITQTNDKTTLVISNFRYLGTYMDEVVAIDYELKLDGKVIATGGYDIEKMRYNNQKFNIQNFFKIITVYLDSMNNYDFDNAKYLAIKFKYIDRDGETSYFELPLKVERKFTNNKFVYFK